MKLEKAVIEFPETELQIIKQKMLDWLQPFSILIYLDNNEYKNQPNRYECVAAAGIKKTYSSIPNHQIGQWLFGHICYDYKNSIEPSLNSNHEDFLGITTTFWFEPKVVMYIPFGKNQLVIEGEGAIAIKGVIMGSRRRRDPIITQTTINPKWLYHFTKDEYLNTINNIKSNIRKGDCYELNFCIEAFCKDVAINPYDVFNKINQINPAPFSAFYRNENFFLIAASPERFIYKQEEIIIAQPIKGTIKRGNNTPEDDSLKRQLLNDEKERAENTMIVDLMRNDLGKCCKAGTVNVSEFLGIYTFPKLHQMISTVEGTLKPHISFQEIIHNTFPMGSMTGAPKVKVMQLIEQYERSRRGIFSGSVGYINPVGDFDFNVIIRSIMYNAKTNYLSYQTGGAITDASIAEQEWDEARLKAQAMEAALS